MPDNPAATLRAAAKKLRDTATAATPGPWRTHDTHLNQGGHTATVLTERDDLNDIQLVAWLPTWSHEPWTDGGNAWSNAAHVALMHPGVGLALADWLDSLTGIEISEHGPMPDEFKHALAVARQIVGSEVAE